MNYDGHEALRRDMAGLAGTILRTKTTLKVLEDTYHYRYDGLAERLAGISLRRLQRPMDEAFNTYLMLDESFLSEEEEHVRNP
ncbi:hypothetical protein MJ561_00640 [Klebsiella pneumoniae]|nr:hypothetical protein MJ561_00640 [Klebsiella pneumoniae]